MEVWGTVQQLIKSNKLKKSHFAKEMGISRMTLDSWLNGNTTPTLKDLEKVSSVLDNILDKSSVQPDMSKQKGNEAAALDAAYKTVADGNIQYVLIPLKVLDKTQLVSIDEWEEKRRELERKNGQIDFYQNQIAKLLENMELTPKAANAKKSKE